MKQRSISMRKLSILLQSTALLAAAYSVGLAAPTISLNWDPKLPDHVENPGGQFYGYCLIDPAGTTPLDLIVIVRDPSDVVVYEVILPGYVEYEFLWDIPVNSPDGVYHYEVEYTSAEGENAFARAGFLVAGSVTGLCALKFIDENGNGVYDEGEVFASGWEICATGAADLGCQTTDEDGLTCWFDIPTGDYTVCETLQDGYENTTGGVCQDVTLDEGEIEKVIFGNRETPVPTRESSWGQIKTNYR
jgi:hypothetical protein